MTGRVARVGRVRRGIVAVDEEEEEEEALPVLEEDALLDDLGSERLGIDKDGIDKLRGGSDTLGNEGTESGFDSEGMLMLGIDKEGIDKLTGGSETLVGSPEIVGIDNEGIDKEGIDNEGIDNDGIDNDGIEGLTAGSETPVGKLNDSEGIESGFDIEGTLIGSPEITGNEMLGRPVGEPDPESGNEGAEMGGKDRLGIDTAVGNGKEIPGILFVGVGNVRIPVRPGNERLGMLKARDDGRLVGRADNREQMFPVGPLRISINSPASPRKPDRRELMSQGS